MVINSSSLRRTHCEVSEQGAVATKPDWLNSMTAPLTVRVTRPVDISRPAVLYNVSNSHICAALLKDGIKLKIIKRVKVFESTYIVLIISFKNWPQRLYQRVIPRKARQSAQAPGVIHHGQKNSFSISFHPRTVISVQCGGTPLLRVVWVVFRILFSFGFYRVLGAQFCWTPAQKNQYQSCWDSFYKIVQTRVSRNSSKSNLPAPGGCLDQNDRLRVRLNNIGDRFRRSRLKKSSIFLRFQLS